MVSLGHQEGSLVLERLDVAGGRQPLAVLRERRQHLLHAAQLVRQLALEACGVMQVKIVESVCAVLRTVKRTQRGQSCISQTRRGWPVSLPCLQPFDSHTFRYGGQR